MNDRPNENGQNLSNSETQYASTTGGGRGRQGVGEAFFMSLIRQVARSIGAAVVRAVIGRR